MNLEKTEYGDAHAEVAVNSYLQHVPQFFPSANLMFFDVDSIHINFLNVQSHFKEINSQLDCQRDFFDDNVIANLLHAYRYINQRLSENPERHFIDYHEMLELNAIVLTGIDDIKRKEYQNFLNETQKKASAYIGELMKWYRRHESHKDDPYRIAAGLYVRILAQPQLFIEGNHRTGALVANYHLLMSGELPFILTTANAVTFFNLASDVKFKNRSIKSKFKRATGWHDEKTRMCTFLREYAAAFTFTDMPPSREEVMNSLVAIQNPKDPLSL